MPEPSAPLRIASSPVFGPLDLVQGIAKPEARLIAHLFDQLRGHPLWLRLDSVATVRIFMEHHVWAVWDFMSLVKSVQADVAPIRIPWSPPADPTSAHLINEIVTSEEADVLPDGRHASHFEIYLEAMESAGARTDSIRRFLDGLVRGVPFAIALRESGAPTAAQEFVRSTMNAAGGSLSERVSAFTLGREGIIPSMFSKALAAIPANDSLAGLIWYLERHVEVDGNSHGPLTTRLFERVCSKNDMSLRTALRAGVETLTQRLSLLDAVVEALPEAASTRRPRPQDHDQADPLVSTP